MVHRPCNRVKEAADPIVHCPFSEEQEAEKDFLTSASSPPPKALKRVRAL